MNSELRITNHINKKVLSAILKVEMISGSCIWTEICSLLEIASKSYLGILIRMNYNRPRSRRLCWFYGIVPRQYAPNLGDVVQMKSGAPIDLFIRLAFFLCQIWQNLQNGRFDEKNNNHLCHQ